MLEFLWNMWAWLPSPLPLVFRFLLVFLIMWCLASVVKLVIGIIGFVFDLFHKIFDVICRVIDLIPFIG